MCHLTGTKTDRRRLENRKKEKDLKTERKKQKKRQMEVRKKQVVITR